MIVLEDQWSLLGLCFICLNTRKLYFSKAALQTQPVECKVGLAQYMTQYSIYTSVPNGEDKTIALQGILTQNTQICRNPIWMCKASCD